MKKTLVKIIDGKINDNHKPYQGGQKYENT